MVSEVTFVCVVAQRPEFPVQHFNEYDPRVQSKKF